MTGSIICPKCGPCADPFPSDKINALLNYGYSILSSEIKKFLNSVGLDSQIGFLHETV